MSSVPFSPSWPEGHVARVAGGIADISPVGAPEMRLREAPRRRQDSRQETAPARSQPEVSVIVLNYNGALWLENCLASLRRQTRANQIEVIVADNASGDSSNRLARRLLQGWGKSRLVQLGENHGYSAGNNRAAAEAGGRYLFFLNQDTWLEPDCLERLLVEVEEAGAGIATPLVLDYASENVQTAGWRGFDIFGLVSGPVGPPRGAEVFVASGCGLLIERELFKRLGGFDDEFFMYADECDLCWRAWACGTQIVVARSARLHHRGAAEVNPKGHHEIVENRTSDTKRFYANRNSLLVLLKNCEHLLLLLVPLQMALLAAEAAVMGLATRRWSHVRRAYLEAFQGCWRLRAHIMAERRRIRKLRRRGDVWMLRFLRGSLNRWGELRRWRVFGRPKVDAR